MERDFDKEHQEALERGARVQPRAESVRYNGRTKRIEVELNNGMGISIPAAHLQGLENATAAQLKRGYVTGHGTALRWDELDADVYVPPLMEGVFGTAKWMSGLARAGGRSRSERKAAAARENGRKGGRPRKAASKAPNRST